MTKPTYSLYNIEPVIRTYTGRFVNVFAFDVDDIVIEDIAHALSMQCRFGGHLPYFYSVAQHSIMCSLLVDRKYALEALLHDASEAYLVDVPRPIKSGLLNYAQIETQVQSQIFTKFGIQRTLTKDIKQADEACLLMEWNGIMTSEQQYLSSMEQGDAERTFLARFNELYIK